MNKELAAALRKAAKGTGWSVKRDILVCRVNDYVLGVHPRRGGPDNIEFRAKPVKWDQLLWSILQIEGNERLPPSFHFTGAFVCSTPAIVKERFIETETTNEAAQRMINFAQESRTSEGIWKDYDLEKVIRSEVPPAPYRYHMTRVVERICAGGRETAKTICDEANSGLLDVRHTFTSVDNNSPPDPDGRRPSLSFFELAQIWMERH